MTFRIRSVFTLVLFVVLFSLSTLPGCGPADEARTHVVVAQTSDPAAPEFGVWVAAELGLFEKYGITVELTHAQEGSQAQVLLSGDVDIMLSGPVPLLCAASAGAEVLDIAGLGPTLPYLLLTRPDIQTADDLRGTKLGASSIGATSSYMALRVALMSLGVDPEEAGITIVASGGSSERLAALAAGSLDGTVVNVDKLQRVQTLIDEGLVRLFADMSLYDTIWAQEDVNVTRAFAEQNPEAIEAFLRGLLEAQTWLADPGNREEALAIAAKYVELASTEEAVPYYDSAVDQLSLRPYPSVPALTAFAEILQDDFPELMTFDIEAFADRSWLDRLDEEGFIDSLETSGD